MRVFLVLVIGVFFSGCTRPGDHPINSKCLWIEDDQRTLNLDKRSDRRHLRYDAITAEDVAIRWADNNFHLLPEWEQRHNECMETMFNGIAKQHSVDVNVVRQYRFERDVVLDSVVIFVFGVLYLLACYFFAGRIRRRFEPDEPGFWVMSLAMAIGISLLGIMIGGFGSIIIEEVRLGSGHLSYRMNRILFRQHWALLWLCGFVIFLFATLLRNRVVKYEQARS